MANANRGAVALEAGDKVYSLRFTTNSICELEDHFGQPISQVVEAMQDGKGVGMKMIRGLVWGALIDQHPDMDLKEAGAVLDAAGQDAVMEKVGLAMQRFFPDREEGKENPPKAEAK